MKVKFFLILCLSLLMAFTACSDKKQSQTIITHKPKKEKVRPIQKVGDYKDSMLVRWGSAYYNIFVSRTADADLPIVKDEDGIKFYDNSIIIKIRKKGSSEVLFEHTFIKKDFVKYLENKFFQENVLQGVVYDRVDTHYLYFVGSVGSGDKSNDEYVPFEIKISKAGNMSIQKSSAIESIEEETI